jgi:hypothetical protein
MAQDMRRDALQARPGGVLGYDGRHPFHRERPLPATKQCPIAVCERSSR